MKRRELKKAIKEYSRKTNFYKLGLIRKWIQYEEKQYKKLKKAIPKVVCPECGNKGIEIASSDSEYDSEKWLYCDMCDTEFDDEFNYINAFEDLRDYCWCDTISVTLHFDKPDINTLEWKEFCEREILRMVSE